MDMLSITAMIILLKEAQEKMKLGGQSAAPVTARHSFENSQNFSFFLHTRTHAHTHSHIRTSSEIPGYYESIVV